jgi:hypothetical protein
MTCMLPLVRSRRNWTRRHKADSHRATMRGQDRPSDIGKGVSGRNAR